MVGRALLAVLLLFHPAAAASSPTASVSANVEYARPNGKALLLDAYALPAGGNERRPAVILIHGGGFRQGDKSSFEPEARRIATQGWVAFSVNYRLDEPSAFPAELDDVRTAVHWVRDHAREYQVDPDRIGLLGESAGGTLAALLATTEPGITAAVSWSGPMDLVAFTAIGGDAWAIPIMGCSLTACRDKFADASPINHVDSHDAPIQLQNSENELVPEDQAINMAKKMDAVGLRGGLRLIRGSGHALDYRGEAIGPSVEFLRQYLDKAPKTQATTAAFWLTVVAITVVGGILVWRRRGSNLRRREPANVP